MESEIANRLKLRYSPIAVLFANAKPAAALEFAAGRWGCVAALLTAAAKGRQAVFSRSSFGCLGGGVGLGFGNMYPQFPGGFEHFLSTGKEGYREGEAYKKTPELAKSFVESLPITDIPEQFVVFKPLSAVEPQREEPRVIVFYANPDQLSALVVLANYGRPGHTNVVIPFGAGCQSTCLLPWHEAGQEYPKAVVGMTDISARPVIDADLLAFSVPWVMYQEMENNVPGSFLDKPAWHKVAERIPEAK
ncbi:putative ArCR [Sporomusa termitida]|uniref:Putative ArCR n=2 Tax=Sporomusa termitida TaxID=2377 RepID=A0A517DRG4_9FIRM|nr:putative ArCR [Sporomusa termitida]